MKQDLLNGNRSVQGLLAIHNDLEGATRLKLWKHGKAKLVARIKALLAAIPESSPAEDEAQTIRKTALDLLCQVDYHEDKNKKASLDNRLQGDDKNARSVGLPYLDIIASIRDRFPNSQTSVACLRWYAVKIRAEEFGYEGSKLAQRRPRARPNK